MLELTLRPIRLIALHTGSERRAMFVRHADEAVCIDAGAGARRSGYLDYGALERALVTARADAAWVGWGFVAEQPEFGELCERLDKTAVEVPDAAGFVVNKLLFPYLFDAVRLLERDGLSPDAIDTCMKLGAGHPMGPLALLDFVGLDTTYSIANIMFDEFRETRFAPPPLLKRMVLAGHLGKKSGRGFYAYA